MGEPLVVRRRRADLHPLARRSRINPGRPGGPTALTVDRTCRYAPGEGPDGCPLASNRRLVVPDGDRLAGEATIGAPAQGIGVLWWIAVEPPYRGSGAGRALLGSTLDLLAGLGAREVILYVDDDGPGGERDRAAANRLYESAGFTEVDRLHSYQRR